MGYRKDINGLRAIAVIAVVLFHFFPSWLTGGFVGVDVFFVISGFLMTGIIFRGLAQDNFSNLKFYIARANRIIPALAFLCLFLLFFGFLTFTPHEYRELGKHVIGSIGFFSNIVYWSESGYFDTSSHEKWLLHTWSLSVEWQFYLIYPIILSTLHKFISLRNLKRTLIVATIISFACNIYFTYSDPTGAYYLLTSRIWQMLIGGIAYLYHFDLLKRYKQQSELLGVILIVTSCFLILPTYPWPGYLALLPVLGTFLILQSNNNGVVTNNITFQKIGTWSYSIYLWHWPIVVFINVYSLNEYWTISGIFLSVFLGFLSHRFIEQAKFKSSFRFKELLFKCFPLVSVYFIGVLAILVYKANGELALSTHKLANVTQNILRIPKRTECHSSARKYIIPSSSCDYFSTNVNIAVFGDSHGVEIAYALAKAINDQGRGVKHLTFSACHPSYKQSSNSNKCIEWTNDAVAYLLENEEIENVVVIYRVTSVLFGTHRDSYPQLPPIDVNYDKKRNEIINSLTELIHVLAESKKNVIIIKPIPELGFNINRLIREAYRNSRDVNNIMGTSLRYYLERHAYILRYFEENKFPENVKLVDPTDYLCDKSNCWAIKEGAPLYFDDNHLSIKGAELLVDSIVDNLR